MGPHINKLVPLDFYREEFRKAQGNPADELGFRIYMLGQYVRNHKAFIDMSAWQQCKGEVPHFPEKQPAVIGLDNGGANDLLAITVLIPRDGKTYVETISVISEEALRKKNKLGEIQYQAWADKNFLKIIGEETITLPELIQLLEEIYDRYEVKALSYDPWQCKGLKENFEKKRRLIIETPQYGRFMNPLILEFERAIKERTLVHSGNVLLDFCVENLQVEADRYGRLQCAKESKRHKIDLAVSTIIAFNALPEAVKPARKWEGKSVFVA